MKALMSVVPGGPDTLELRELPTPEPGPNEVLVEVAAAGVNFPDTLIIRDLYQYKPDRPFAPGAEIAGVVAAVGDGVSAFKPGDRVAALPGSSGGFATHVICPAHSVMPIPPSLPFEQAAGFALTYGTSHYALKVRGQAKKEETLFILGAAGGVGSAAIELGKAMGLRVVAGVSSPSKADFCRELGADEVVVYSRDLDRDGQKALSQEIKAACGGGADIVYDAVGGDYAEPALRAMNWEGRYLVVGFPAGIPKLPLNLTLLKSCQVIGVFWGAAIRRDPEATVEWFAEIHKWIAEGKLNPRITARYPLAEGAKALEALESRTAMGKIVLTMT